MAWKLSKRQIRERFRKHVYERDGHKCKICMVPITECQNLEVHHITDRNEIFGGGYVKENGITLCPKHHDKAEDFHRNKPVDEGFYPNDLYALIGSTRAKAEEAARKELDE